MSLGSVIMSRRKELGYTQQGLADLLMVSFQTISKWETGSTCPDIAMLPRIAGVLGISIDSLFEYHAGRRTDYEEKYSEEEYYWGIEPNEMCYEIMKRKPPIKPYRVLDIGCGEGKDAVFFARNGYHVTAFDVAENGIEKGKELAERQGVDVNFFKADLLDYCFDDEYDIIFCSGVLHYIVPEKRNIILENMKKHTRLYGLQALNVFVEKPFIEPAPDLEESEKRAGGWKSGELFGYYHEWLFYEMREVIFDCNSGGTWHRHCMNVLLAERMK